MKILIIGNGWIGNRCEKEWGHDTILVKTLLSDYKQILSIIDTYNPDAVLNAAGIVGKPNVDWCEDHVIETYEGNTRLPIEIAKACAEKGIYMLHIGTGCVYYGYKKGGWLPDDHANPEAVYTRSKYAADLILSKLPNVGIARIRMPIDSIPHPANLINKLATYKKIVHVVNSVTVMDDMIKAFRIMLEKKVEGIHHIVNPHPVTHKEIMDLYKKHVDENFDCEWITEEELVKSGLAKKKRSNTILDSNSLRKYGIKMRPTCEAIEDSLKKYKNNI